LDSLFHLRIRAHLIIERQIAVAAEAVVATGIPDEGRRMAALFLAFGGFACLINWFILLGWNISTV
jgi:hypothetical protein